MGRSAGLFFQAEVHLLLSSIQVIFSRETRCPRRARVHDLGLSPFGSLNTSKYYCAIEPRETSIRPYVVLDRGLIHIPKFKP